MCTGCLVFILILCTTASVLPKSKASAEKMSWNSRTNFSNCPFHLPVKPCRRFFLMCCHFASVHPLGWEWLFQLAVSTLQVAASTTSSPVPTVSPRCSIRSLSVLLINITGIMPSAVTVPMASISCSPVHSSCCPARSSPVSCSTFTCVVTAVNLGTLTSLASVSVACFGTSAACSAATLPWRGPNENVASAQCMSMPLGERKSMPKIAPVGSLSTTIMGCVHVLVSLFD